MKAIELKNVSLSFDGADALKQIDLSIDEGSFVGLVGPNGGGKTTLLKIILGLIKPDQGVVSVFGRPPEKTQGKIGYVPQYSDFDPEFPINVREVVEMGRLGRTGFFNRFSKKDKEIVRESLEKVEMADLMDRRISDLSGGQHQRVLIARALATRPEILLLDEPTASIDQKIKENIYELLETLNESGITILVSTHDTGVVYSKMTSIACINQKIVYHGEDEIPLEVFEEAYGAPVSILSDEHPDHPELNQNVGEN
ncbi:ABC-type Mn/Zn transport system ATPase component [Methanonatronarchaeum thermophilum]|uniref:ABC-type Mn/Zn transport system ATPase component n=1 Tax=Methanonatronarchaeum thermophilum TaxID=1927129 RepID=A0A1Y3GIJ8_9EURY|nr:ABC transporter ATP-binding protein [Methanonatronarchaeum thermophilum]OUJ19226.1 ABC-type Mn/Zn transport system ATPase component [Methanonatronarchaeum thermophilum]